MEVVEYYRAMAKFLLPHLRNRPISFKRFPDGVGGEFFWEKDAPAFTPARVKRFPVPRRDGGPPIRYILVNDTRTLLWIASVGGIELHPFLHIVPDIHIATHVVFDLDPGEGADILDCARVALLLRDMLQTLKLQSFAKVSGSKGIQVYVPLQAEYEVTQSFARRMAETLARQHPRLIVAKMSKELRRGKVFIDWSQNAVTKTTIGVYSFRATGLVSMPVKWEELEKPRKLTWTAEEAIARVTKLGDLFGGLASRRPYRRPPAGEDAGRTAAGTAAPHVPKRRSQSGRRPFRLMNTELWLDAGGMFILLDDTGIEDSGAYEIVRGSFERERLELWFSGNVLEGPRVLEKKNGSWRLSR